MSKSFDRYPYLKTSSAGLQAPAVGAEPAWTEDQIARACANAEIPDSRFEALIMALDDLDQFDAQKAHPPVQGKLLSSEQRAELMRGN